MTTTTEMVAGLDIIYEVWKNKLLQKKLWLKVLIFSWIDPFMHTVLQQISSSLHLEFWISICFLVLLKDLHRQETLLLVHDLSCELLLPQHQKGHFPGVARETSEAQ